jgi:aerobic carbon-monoxide dehydrogenase medium subunit
VYPSPFAYHAPATMDEALRLLARLPDAKILAGGQSLIPLMNLGLARPGALVDVNGLPGLDGATEDRGDLRLGALVRHRALETSPVVRRCCPLFAEAASLIGNIRVRHRGTLGGSLAHADPAAELPLVAVALGAAVEVRHAEGRREVAVETFFRGYLLTDLAPGEMVTGLRIPAFGPATGYGLAELVRRAGDFALVAACAVVDVDGAGRCLRASLALGGVGPYPLRARRAEALLVGAPLTDRRITEAAGAVPDEVSPESDVHASAAYRRAMARVMAHRALLMARTRAERGPRPSP